MGVVENQSARKVMDPKVTPNNRSLERDYHRRSEDAVVSQLARHWVPGPGREFPQGRHARSERTVKLGTESNLFPA